MKKGPLQSVQVYGRKVRHPASAILADLTFLAKNMKNVAGLLGLVTSLYSPSNDFRLFF